MTMPALDIRPAIGEESFTEWFERETRRKIGHEHRLAIPDRDPEWSDFRDLFPSTRAGRDAAMRAAGFDKPGRPLPKKGTKARTTRDTYRRRIERYLKDGGEQRRPKHLEPRERRVIRAQWRRRATPHTVRQVLELVWLFGATVTELVAAFDYEAGRVRHLDKVAVGVRPAVLRRSGFTRGLFARDIFWEELANAFLLAYGRAYGMGDFTAGGAQDVRAFTYRVGYTDEAQYDYGTASRPAGARNVPKGSPKYRGVRR